MKFGEAQMCKRSNAIDKRVECEAVAATRPCRKLSIQAASTADPAPPSQQRARSTLLNANARCRACKFLA
eukprot:1925854-Pleurochrysis_carterae.AAC.4